MAALLRCTAAILSFRVIAPALALALPSQNDHVPAAFDLRLRSQQAADVGGGVFLRIMPLGASITFGDGSSTGNGYRDALRTILTQDGNPVDFVGSRANGTMPDNQSEGWPGATIDEIFSHARDSVPSTLPNLVLINAGTNDCTFDVAPATAPDRLLELMRYLWVASPLCSIVISTLLVNGDETTEACVGTVNEGIKAMVAQQQALSRKVVIVDLHGPAGPTLEDLVDGTHPNDGGYEKMARLWFEGIRDAASRGWLEAPQVLPEVTTTSEAVPTKTAALAS